MQDFGWVPAAVAGWTGIGVLGTVLALTAGDRRRAWRGVGWMAGVWVAYLAVLLGVGRWQGHKVLEMGREECFGEICYSVTGVSSVGEFRGLGGRLVQVGIRVRNGGKATAGAEGMRAYLVDQEGRQWSQTRGVGGVALTIALPPGGMAVSEPVFRVEDGTRGLGLVLTRGYVGWGWLTIGDTDSLGHHRTLLRLE